MVRILQTTGMILSLALLATTTQAGELQKNFIGEPVSVIEDGFNSEEAWGLCTIIDLHGCKNIMNECDASEESIKRFVIELCELIDMNRYGAPAIKWFGTGGVEGYTLTQLIETSCISAHWADDRVFIDIFSCKFYNPYEAVEFVKNYFQAEDASVNVWLRA